MTRPVRGLYEALITDALDANLRAAGPRAVRQQLRGAEAADRIALHLAGLTTTGAMVPGLAAIPQAWTVVAAVRRTRGNSP